VTFSDVIRGSPPPHGKRLACFCCKSVAMKSKHILWLYGLLAFQKISFGKNCKRESKDRYYQADLYYVLLWNLLNWLPYHALKVSLMQYHANPSTDFFPTSHVALPWVIYIHPISVDFVATVFQLKHCSRLPCPVSTFAPWHRVTKNKHLSLPNRLFFMLASVKKSGFFHAEITFVHAGITFFHAAPSSVKKSNYFRRSGRIPSTRTLF
jgi:hypothetical protein